jgi:hypothetical protein
MERCIDEREFIEGIKEKLLVTVNRVLISVVLLTEDPNWIDGFGFMTISCFAFAEQRHHCGLIRNPTNL